MLFRSTFERRHSARSSPSRRRTSAMPALANTFGASRRIGGSGLCAEAHRPGRVSPGRQARGVTCLSHTKRTFRFVHDTDSRRRSGQEVEASRVAGAHAACRTSDELFAVCCRCGRALRAATLELTRSETADRRVVAARRLAVGERQIGHAATCARTHPNAVSRCGVDALDERLTLCLRERRVARDAPGGHLRYIEMTTRPERVDGIAASTARWRTCVVPHRSAGRAGTDGRAGLAHAAITGEAVRIAGTSRDAHGDVAVLARRAGHQPRFTSRHSRAAGATDTTWTGIRRARGFPSSATCPKRERQHAHPR